MSSLYKWNFGPVLENLDVLWAGALGTLRLFVICVVLGFGFGLVVGLGRHARSRWVHLPATAFVEFFRNTPVLVQILWFYYALPILLPFQIGPLTAAALGISLNFHPTETYTVIAVVFFLCLFPLVQATYALERRLGRSDA